MITITHRSNIASVQEDFNRLFPYLKLVLLNDNAQKGSGKHSKHAGKSFADYWKKIEEEIVITPSITVSELEKRIAGLYKLRVQLFRNTGKAWLQTSLTDGWTLAEQNRQGEELSVPI